MGDRYSCNRAGDRGNYAKHPEIKLLGILFIYEQDIGHIIGSNWS
jgi:hypothetical protein